ncbi:enoyl-CoA hydratase-related protein [Inmirania thermothiophila]|uniref:Enoyl-CoA hydratase n=1 Tax=Inmirania thermothiophila TaxID=1750597 RepID=A0A3N1Y9J1_9GAMM|nr:enoyl-CoA hydratase-related protein [Inmirania thermothiophila]ROR35211.1 enoyl-CoA hydratase [Inmirania thermothiophila]
MSEPVVLYDEPEAGIGRLTINRPRVLNALNRETLEALRGRLEALRGRDDLRALIVTGAGEKAFVAGGDIAEMRTMSAVQARAFSELGLATLRLLETMPVPVIAAVNGYALGGGCELALACDWIVASERAVLGQPEVNLGVTPGFGGTQRLLRRVGTARALELVTTGRQVKTEEALRIGLVNQVVAPEALMDTVLAQARMIAARGPVAVRLAKEAVQRGQDLDLDNACVLEREIFALCFATEDQKEGMGAFLEKRAARFAGR